MDGLIVLIVVIVVGVIAARAAQSMLAGLGVMGVAVALAMVFFWYQGGQTLDGTLDQFFAFANSALAWVQGNVLPHFAGALNDAATQLENA